MSPGTIAGSTGSFTVTGSHMYSEAGLYTITVTVAETDNAATAQSSTATATVADAALSAAGRATVTIHDVDGSQAHATTTIAVSIATVNSPPRCTRVTATPTVLWTPNHRFVLVRLRGATDPDGDALTYTIAGVRQDEKVSGLGRGDRAPDAKRGPTTNSVFLRSERQDSGKGRLYVIAFTVSDGHGGTCAGTVKVSVPHDRHHRVVDTGKRFNSFAPAPAPSHRPHH